MSSTVLATEVSPRPSPGIRLILLLAALGVFIGQSWISYRGETRVYAFLHSEALAKSLVEKHLGMQWDEWVSDEGVADTVGMVVRGQAWLHGLAGLACLVLSLIPSWKTRFLRGLRLILMGMVLLASIDLCLLAWLNYLNSGRIPFHYLEYAAICVAPPVFLLVGVMHYRCRCIPLVVKVALAATFVVHGLYAMGFEVEHSAYRYETPGAWIEMGVNGMGRAAALAGSEGPGEETVADILKLAGVLDLVAAILIFIPWIDRLGLIYMVLWGGLTAVARTWSNYVPMFAWETLEQWIPESLLRFPHWALPLFLLVLSFGRGKRQSPEIQESNKA